MAEVVRQRLKTYLLPGTLAALLLWAYAATLTGLAHTWSTDPQYSHGFLVPVFALVLLWQRRDRLATLQPRPSWFAVPLLALAVAMHLTGAYYFSPWLEQTSLLLAVAGVCLAVAGWDVLRAAGPALAFLAFMIPLPGRLDKVLAQPLQYLSTLASTNALQTFGFFAQSEGNVILLSDYELGIVEACSGLRMLMVFVATSTAVALMLRRSLVQRLLVVASAVPIALLCNVIRITVTGVMHETAGHELANKLYHGVAGWLMAPMALAFLGIELLVFRKLFVPVDAAPTTRELGRSRLALAPIATERNEVQA